MDRDIEYPPSELHADLGANFEKLVPYSQDVAIDRGRCVAEVSFHIAALRSMVDDGEASHDMIRCVKAYAQKTTAQHDQQAAHLLPGQLVVNASPIWSVGGARGGPDVPLIQHRIKKCFGETNVLPTLFNVADREAEGTGKLAPFDTLKPMYGEIMQRFWHDARSAPGREVQVDRDATFAALEEWFRRVSVVYADAAHRKAGRGRVQEARVLETYANSFRVANVGRFVVSELPAVYQMYRFRRR